MISCHRDDASCRCLAVLVVCLLPVLGACTTPAARPAVEVVSAAPAVAAESASESGAARPSPRPVGEPAAEQMPVVRERNVVFFQRGATQPEAAGDQVLQAHAQRLKDDPRLVVTLVGHTDHNGSRSYNLAIAEKRTAAVMERLRELGVPAKQIRRRHYGNEAAPNCRSESCRARMRRVDLVYPRPATSARPATRSDRPRGTTK
jgi:outer membrane protein OmpA-like peptidoglycan-associated protein